MANFDKSLYQAPAGLDALAQDAEPIEIEVVDPAQVNMHVGDTDISMTPTEPDFAANLAEEADESALASLAEELIGDIDNDKESRKDWEKAYVDGIKLLGLQYEERTEPWNGACGVFHPMITEAVIRFQSEAITETFPASGPVRTKILGKETPEKKEAAARVEHDMNNELTEVMREFRPEHERMLWSLPATGSAFKKVYYDPSLGRQVSVFIPAEDVILPYGTTDLDTCYRVTHVMRKTRNEILKLQQAGFYRDVDLDDTAPKEKASDIQQAKDKETGFTDINDDRFVLYECHVDLDLEGFEDKDADGEETGIALPYVVTLLEGTGEILAIRRNWAEDDVLRLKRQHFVHYQYIPGFGAYGFGLFHLIGGFAKSATSIMRQLVDAGTLSNLPGGLKARGLRIKGDDTPIAPGEFRDVDIGSGALRDNILPLPYKEPSGVLYQLLGNIVEEGRRFAATADMSVSDMSAQAPVGTTLALLERQLKVMTAIQARLHYSLKQELGLLADIIRDYTEQDYQYDPDDNVGRQAKREDYSHVDIIPVSDPNAATMSQRVVQYQAVIQMAQMAPDIYDMKQLHRGMLDVLGVKNAAKLVPLDEDKTPTDPVTENMDALNGKPIKAFQYQDHESHIQVHTAAMQDPLIMQLMGQNPRAPGIMAAMHAHIAEHVGFAYRQKIEQRLGMALPKVSDDRTEDTPMDPQVEYRLSQMMVQAGQQVLQQSQTVAAQKAAQQAAQDPVVQMQQQQQQLDQQDLQIKAQKVAADAQAKQQALELDKYKADQKAELERMRIELQGAQSRGTLTLQHKKDAVNAAMQVATLASQTEKKGGSQ